MLKKIPLLLVMLTLFSCATKQERSATNSNADQSQSLAELLGGPTKKVDEKELAKYPLGSKENPVRVAGPAGERDYLKRLVCENNEPVSTFERHGSAGAGPFGSVMDVYDVLCDTNKGVVTHTVFLDMYHGDYEETRPANGFIALKPDCWSSIRKAVTFREQKKYTEALEQIELHNQCDTSTVRMSYYYHLGWTYAEMGEPKKAIEAFSEGLKTDPNYLFAYWRRGMAQEQLGNLNEAKADYKKAYSIGIEKNPEKFKALLDESPNIAEKLLPK